VYGGVVSKCLKKIRAFKVKVTAVSNKNGMREEKEIFADPFCIASFKDALVTENLAETDLNDGGEYLDAPLGAPVFNVNGLMYGYLIDICFNKNFEVTKLVYDRPFGIQKIISVSNDAIIAKAAAKRKQGKPDVADGGSICRRYPSGIQRQNDGLSPKNLSLYRSHEHENFLDLKNSDQNSENFSARAAFQGFNSDNILQFSDMSSILSQSHYYSRRNENLKYENQIKENLDALNANRQSFMTGENLNEKNQNEKNFKIPNIKRQSFVPYENLIEKNFKAPNIERQPFASYESSKDYYFNKYPQKLIGGYTFLLGRTVGEDIKNIKDEIIIERGSVITDDVVEKAGVYGKLVELTFNSVK
jgi:hypothetical protein